MFKRSTKQVSVKGPSHLTTYRESLLRDIHLHAYLTLGEKTYLSQLHEWTTDDTLILAAPMDQLTLIKLEPSTLLKLKLTSQSALFTAQVKVLDTVQQEGTTYYRCQLMNPLTRTQQRQFFRLNTLLDASCKLIEPKSPNFFKGTIINLSIGGAYMTNNMCLTEHSFIEITFNFLNTSLTLLGEVLTTGQRLSSGSYSHRIKFVSLSLQEEQLLNRLIMEKQRLQRKNS